MVVERSKRRCLLCGTAFEGRTFLCRHCSDRYRNGHVPLDVRRKFYEELDRAYPERSNTYGAYNEPVALLRAIDRLPRSLRILELGAGGGFLAEQLYDLGFVDITLSDFSATALDELQYRFPDTAVIGADASQLPFQEHAFDVVISSDLIEHLPDADRHLAEVARVLAPGGLYLVKTPNRRVAEAYYRLRGVYDYHFWHPSMFSSSELGSLLEEHGFDVQFLRPDRLTGAQLAKMSGPTSLKSLAKHLPVRAVPVAIQPHLEVVAKKRGSSGRRHRISSPINDPS